MIPGAFSKLPIPKTLPTELEAMVTRLAKTKTKRECLEKAFTYVTTYYYGERFTTYLKFWRAFTKDIGKIWARRGFIHCNHINFLLRVLLVRSGKFTERDIRQKLTLYLLVSPHQYLRVNVGTAKRANWIDVDPWATRVEHITIGQHAGL